MPLDYAELKVLPVKTLNGIPNHVTYREKLERKWRKKGFQVRFCG